MISPLAIVFILIFGSLPSVLVKGAARLSRTKLSWKHSFIFGFTIALLSITVRALSPLAGFELPISLSIVLGALIYLSAGSWYFSSRGKNDNGTPVGFRGGLKLMVIFLLMLAALVGVNIAIVSLTRR